MFRAATQEDAPMLKEIAKYVIRNNYTTFLGEDAVNSFIDSGASDMEIDNGLDSCIVMVEGSSIIGFAITNNAVLHLIMIAVGCQNQGFGSKLLAHIEAQMFNTFDDIELQTFENNVLAIRFYQKHGWELASAQQENNLPLTVCHFRKNRTT